MRRRFGTPSCCREVLVLKLLYLAVQLGLAVLLVVEWYDLTWSGRGIILQRLNNVLVHIGGLKALAVRVVLTQVDIVLIRCVRYVFTFVQDDNAFDVVKGVEALGQVGIMVELVCIDNWVLELVHLLYIRGVGALVVGLNMLNVFLISSCFGELSIQARYLFRRQVSSTTERSMKIQSLGAHRYLADDFKVFLVHEVKHWFLVPLVDNLCHWAKPVPLWHGVVASFYHLHFCNLVAD